LRVQKRQPFLDHSTTFWVEGGTERADRARLSSDLPAAFGPTLVTELDAVVAVKRWLHSKTERSLVVLDSADDDGGDDDQSYINLELFLPDTPATYTSGRDGNTGASRGGGWRLQVAATPRLSSGIYFISTQVSRTTETVTEHEGKEADSLIW
jgi:hypothetical protein